MVFGGSLVFLVFGLGFPIILAILLRRRRRAWKSTRVDVMKVYTSGMASSAKVVADFFKAAASWQQLGFLHSE